jgi:hypothetical protein
VPPYFTDKFAWNVLDGMEARLKEHVTRTEVGSESELRWGGCSTS